MTEVDAITQIGDAVLSLIAALGFIPTTVAAPLVALGTAIGVLFGVKNENKRFKKQLEDEKNV